MVIFWFLCYLGLMQDSVIHGFIPANRASYYRSELKVGSVLRVERFEVAKSSNTYKITEHQFVIRFIPATRVSEVKSGAPAINHDKFMIRTFNRLQMLANTNLELPDVVGEIRSVQGSDLRNSSVNERVVVRLLIEPNATVYLSLWDEAASTFRGILAAGDKSQSVMLVTTVNPKLFGGNLYLNSTAGTRFYFDTTLPEIFNYVERFGGGPSQVFTCMDTLEGIKKKEHVSILDLNNYISNVNEQSQEADFICKARVVGVLQQNGWSFVACTACNRKLERSGNAFSCSRCDTADVTGVVRFRVELSVDDGKDTATFVVFDKEMTKVTKREAADIELDSGVQGLKDELPHCLQELSGREFAFQIRVTPFNFTPNHRSFTVSIMNEESALEKQDEAENITDTEVELGMANEPVNLPGAMDDDGGEPTGEGPTSNVDSTKTRKRRRV